MISRDRRYDVVLFGATGFTGSLTAEYLARHAPTELRLAVAGRDVGRLERLAAQLALLVPDRPPVGVIHADVTDLLSMRGLASSARVVASTVGPFVEHGEPLVAACVDVGTDYLDICGESEFVDRMWLGYHDQARAAGIRLVHCCGFDSIPADLGVWYTLRHLPEGVPLSIRAYVRVHATFSAGTYRSAIGVLGRHRQGTALARRRRQLDRGPASRQVHSLPGRPHRDTHSGRWAVPLPVIDPVIVRRSARALDRYGPDFSYGQYALVRRLPVAAGLMAGAGGVAALAQLPPVRDALLRRQSPGTGPSPERRAASWFRTRFVAKVPGSDDPPVVTEVAGGDPGYDETAMMLGESAICLATDDLPEVAGQVTTAQVMGDALTERLIAGGLTFRVVS